MVLSATNFLKEKSSSPRLDAEIIIADVLGCGRTDLYVNSKKELDSATLQKCLQKVERRIAGEPVAYITNKKDFLNHTFFVQEGVLVPRPETEHIVEYALHWIENHPSIKVGNAKTFWVLDLGCGSGCVGLSFLKEVLNIQVVAVDISDKAIETSRINAQRLDVNDRYTLIQKNADLLTAKDFEILKEKGFNGDFDIVISNPPYISFTDELVEENVRNHEPQEALFCESDGLEKIEKWSALAAPLLTEKGLLVFEIGASQGERAKKAVQDTDFFEDCEVATDYSGRDRFVIAVRKIDRKTVN